MGERVTAASQPRQESKGGGKKSADFLKSTPSGSERAYVGYTCLQAFCISLEEDACLSYQRGCSLLVWSISTSPLLGAEVRIRTGGARGEEGSLGYLLTAVSSTRLLWH